MKILWHNFIFERFFIFWGIIKQGVKVQNKYRVVLLFTVLIILLMNNALFSLSIIGKKYPDIVLQNSAGKKIGLSKYIGNNIVLINIWAYWCMPCRMYLNKNNELFNKFLKQGLKIIAINIDGRKKSIVKYIKRKKIPFITLSSNGNWASPVVRKFNVNSIPFCVLIDKSGIIRFTGHPAMITHELLQRALSDNLPDVTAVKFLQLLTRVERNIKFESQKMDWRTFGRQNWLSKTQNPGSPQEMTELLINLEKSFLSNYLKREWHLKRDEWHKKLETVKNYKKLGKLLLSLYNAIIKSSFNKNWHGNKEMLWLRNVKELIK